MLFDSKKLEINSAEGLLQCRINTVKPYALMLGPVYVFMKRNERFVSIKAPLDFFTPQELASFERFEMFHLPKAVAEVSGYQTAGKLVREIIKASRIAVPPPPFEVSDEIAKVISPVWGKIVEMSPFCATIFTDELCGPLAPSELMFGRDTAVTRHDLGLLLSGFLVFALVHLGWFDLDLVRTIRAETYSRTIRGEEWREPTCHWESINRDLIRFLDSRSFMSRFSLQTVDAEWAKQMFGRLDRIAKNTDFFENQSLQLTVGGFTW
ncbi:MAG: hypothetical protein EBX52_13175 [Proteobacteria bacterium]|nr:hypothetical protein [Pseudomonadota bacterium]